MKIWHQRITYVQAVEWESMLLPDTDPSKIDLWYSAGYLNKRAKAAMSRWLNGRRIKADHATTMIHTDSGLVSALDLSNKRKHSNQRKYAA